MSMVERRRQTRYPKRAAVNLFTPGSESRLTGWMTNVSVGGAYVQTTRNVAVKTRLRVQVGDGASSWMVEATVVSCREVLPGMRSVEQPGVGLRFFRPVELVGQLVGGGTGKTDPRQRMPGSEIAPISVDLSQVGTFGEVFLKELRAGGMFVKSARIVELQSVVRLAVLLPGIVEPVPFDVQVVKISDLGFDAEFVDRDFARQTFGEIAMRWSV